MKRLLLAVAVLASSLVILAATGWHRGKACPPYFGYACYELTHGEEPDQILRFIEYATQVSGDVKRWSGTQDAKDAIRAHRASLRYSIAQGQGQRFLHLWCSASTGATAADGPSFPGLLAHASSYGAPSLQKSPAICYATPVTDAQKMLFGLGLFPLGAALPLEPSK